MNRTYKVAKSLTRGVVVTSEKASSYQGKAVKTVIAAAAALVAGSAIAAPSYVAPSDSITPLVNTGITELEDLNKNAETVWKHTEVNQATENFSTQPTTSPLIRRFGLLVTLRRLQVVRTPTLRIFTRTACGLMEQTKLVSTPARSMSRRPTMHSIGR